VLRAKSACCCKDLPCGAVLVLDSVVPELRQGMSLPGLEGLDTSAQGARHERPPIMDNLIEWEQIALMREVLIINKCTVLSAGSKMRKTAKKVTRTSLVRPTARILPVSNQCPVSTG